MKHRCTSGLSIASVLTTLLKVFAFLGLQRVFGGGGGGGEVPAAVPVEVRVAAGLQDVHVECMQ